MTRIIRHSDDLGVTRQSTAQVLDAWRAGYLDGFSIIVNGDAVAQIPTGLSAAPDLPARIAVHFNLTEGYPSAAVKEVPMLVDASGQFRHSFGSLLGTVLFSSSGKRLEFLRQIACECSAQIAAARMLCGTRAITAIDGHIHIHMIPGVFAVVARAALNAHIPEIRISDEPFYLVDPWRDWRRLFWWINLVKHILLRVLSIRAHAFIRQTGLHAPDAVIGVLYTGRMSAARALSGIKAAVGAAEIEVLFHIGRANSAEAGRWRNPADTAFHLSELRDTERKELRLLSERLHVGIPSA